MMKAMRAKKNVRKNRKAKHKARSKEEKELIANKRRLNLQGQKDASCVLDRLYGLIEEASLAGRTEYKLCPSVCSYLKSWDGEAGPNYFAGMRKVVEADLVDNGFEVNFDVRAISDTVWHGMMSDLVPSFHFKYWSLTIVVSWGE